MRAISVKFSSIRGLSLYGSILAFFTHQNHMRSYSPISLRPVRPRLMAHAPKRVRRRLDVAERGVPMKSVVHNWSGGDKRARASLNLALPLSMDMSDKPSRRCFSDAPFVDRCCCTTSIRYYFAIKYCLCSSLRCLISTLPLLRYFRFSCRQLQQNGSSSSSSYS